MNRTCDQKTILIIDDDEFISGALKNLLELDGYRVVHSQNGRVAIETLKELSPCLILLDMQMPVMNGDQFLDHMLLDKELSQIPIIVVSAVSNAIQVKRKGAVAYFDKTVDLPQLLLTVKDYCSGAVQN